MCVKFRLVLQTLQDLTERVNCGGVISTYVSEIQTTSFMLILKSITFGRTRLALTSVLGPFAVCLLEFVLH